jgi:hypothetical protein
VSDWDDEPRLDERRAAAPDVPRHRARKNRRRWCRGKVGVEHVLDVRVSRHLSALNRVGAPCYRPEWWPRSWWCNHERYCTNCGKIIDASLDDQCPDFTTEVTRPRRKR